jgi:streptogramin lyase
VFAILTLPVARAHIAAQSGIALTGVVSSRDEGKMEGVLVTVRGEGANHTVTVVSDARGKYSFPRTHVTPGKYSVTIRAVGYDLAGPSSVEVSSGKTAMLDLQLQQTKDLAMQLTSLDWITIMPGTPAQKDRLAYQPMSCNYCHSYRRIVRSKLDATGLVTAMKRMKSYYVDGTASSDDGRGRIERWTQFGDSGGHPTPKPPTQGDLDGPTWTYTQLSAGGAVPLTEFADYLATANLSGGRTKWPYEIQATLPRPKGAGTRVIITQWDLPHRDTVAHDSEIDSKGNLWVGDESGQWLGRLNPKTNTIDEFPMPDVPAAHLKGVRDVTVDNEDNPWFPMRVDGGAAIMTRLDPQTKKLTSFPEAMTQFTDHGPNDTIWSLGNPIVRIDAKTLKVTGTFKGVPGYQKVVSSKGVVCGAGNAEVACLDTNSQTMKTYKIPSGPYTYGRRGKMDAQDRYWFAEYFTDKIAMFDLKTEKIQEWSVRKYSTPYCVSMPDRRGYVYAPSNMSDRILRLNPKTGEIVEYLMPTELDTKEIHVDRSSPNRTTVLFANKRNARAVRLELLE